MVCAFVTVYCAKLILEVREHTKSNSFTEIGLKLYGKTGRAFVDLCLILSQSGFCCAYIYFIKENFCNIMRNSYDVDINPNILAWVCFIFFSLLCFVRKIEIFASTHIFADMMIFLTVVVVIGYGAAELSKNGSKLD